MFYLLKNLLYLNLVFLKLKCNDLIFNEIRILYVLYVCLLHSRFVENHLIWIPKDRPLIFEVVRSHGWCPGRFLEMLMLLFALLGC
jgi:hypothetical protein